MTDKDQLHQLVDQLGNEQAAALLAQLGEPGRGGGPGEGSGALDRAASAVPGGMTLTLAPAEVRLLRAALRSYLEIFGHDEKDVGATIRAMLTKIPAPQSA